MSETNPVLLQYMPFNSFVSPGFWHRLTQIKLDVDQLNEGSKHIWGFYSNFISSDNATSFEVDSTGFNSMFLPQNRLIPAHGILLNKNTIEQFKDADKLQVIRTVGDQLWQNIINGEAIKDPTLLASFLILSFADLKKYKYFYWFAFPAPTNLTVNIEKAPVEITQVFNQEQIEALLKCYQEISLTDIKSYFCLQIGDNSSEISILPISAVIDQNNITDNLTTFDFNNFYFAFADPCKIDHIGWPLRNFLLLLCYYCPHLYGKTIKIISFRLLTTKARLCCGKSLLLSVRIPEYPNGFASTVFPENTVSFHWSGWEKNDRGKFGPRVVNMESSLDPLRLAETSVDLNLKLMKWRLLPTLNLEKIKDLKCLLLGAGTLGCAVARSLLAWGIRNISFIDSGKVSFSNPVRQCLYTHEDCLHGGKSKALAAADNLKLIFPSVNSVGYNIRIPMPGHTVGDSLMEETQTNVEQLIKLVKEHDVLFLLMDSRESRWLPTLLGNVHKKIVINAALGFDTYLIMRHGYDVYNKPPEEPATPIFFKDGIQIIPGDQLGCYFCNDVTAPGNSLKDRTLDQQCTVTRPGLSAIAGSLAVELLISITQHKEGPYAKAYVTREKPGHNEESKTIKDESLLGIVPHSIRGFLSSFNNVLPATIRYKNCIACSDMVFKEYTDMDYGFLLTVFNSAKVLEDITGLTAIQKKTDLAEIWELSDSDIDTD